MCTMSALKCPLCAQTNFPNIDSLRVSLIKAANGPLACPICYELFLGLDKLTIHLFSHTNVMMTEATTTSATSSKSFHTTNTKRTTIGQTVKKAAVRPEVKLEADDTINSSVVIKCTNKEKKTKKTMQCIRDEPKTVEKFISSTSYNAEPNESEKSVSINMSDNNLYICDICEFIFRDEKLRDMHFRLVHQNASSSSDSDLVGNGTQSSEPDFKCHLCSKTFKMKGSLRVHLKVVHLMCLPYMSNSPKLSICDRIRQKEAMIEPTANKNIHCLEQPIKTDNSGAQILLPQLTQPSQQLQTQTSTQITNGLTFAPLALLPSPTFASNSKGNLLNLNSNGELVHALDGEPLNSNVLLVINTNPAALANPESGTVVFNGETKLKPLVNGSNEFLELQHKNITESTKIWKCNECAKTFTTKYFLKKHKRLHTGEPI